MCERDVCVREREKLTLICTYQQYTSPHCSLIHTQQRLPFSYTYLVLVSAAYDVLFCDCEGVHAATSVTLQNLRTLQTLQIPDLHTSCTCVCVNVCVCVCVCAASLYGLVGPRVEVFPRHHKSPDPVVLCG